MTRRSTPNDKYEGNMHTMTGRMWSPGTIVVGTFLLTLAVPEIRLHKC